MDPLELIHSVERLTAAKDAQSKNLNHIVQSMDQDNVKKIEDEVILHQSQVDQTKEKEALDPDAKGGNAYHKQNSKEDKKPSEDDEKETEDSEDSQSSNDKGNILDIEA